MGKIIEFDSDFRARKKTAGLPDTKKIIKLGYYRRFRQRPLSRFIPEMEGKILDQEIPEWFKRNRDTTQETLEMLKREEQQRWRKKL